MSGLPLVQLPTWGLVVANVAAWGTIHAVTGLYVHRLGQSRLGRDGWLLRLRPWERRRFYERWFLIKRWKDRVPEAGALFAGGVSKRRLVSRDRRGLERFVIEARRAERGHWLAMCAGPVAILWNPPIGSALMVGYGVVANAPFIMIQRYNRARLASVLAPRSSGSVARDPDDPGRRTTGSSMP